MLRVDVVIPAHNEAEILERSIRTLRDALVETLGPTGWVITVALSGSTDDSLAVARSAARELGGIRVLEVREAGRGRALRAAWLSSEAEVVAYVDADLSTDLRALGPLLSPLLTGHSDIAIGTRLARGSRVIRGVKREAISRGYNALLHLSFGTGFSDAQCGFKAARREVAAELLRWVEDEEWFFDSELLVLAERCGMRIAEVPVDWVDDPASSVRLWRTATADLRGIARVEWNLARQRIPIASLYARFGRRPLAAAQSGLLPQLLRFGLVGGVSTILYSLLFLLLGTMTSTQVANFIALLVSAIANTAANRWFTFGVRGSRRLLTHHVQGLLLFGVTWGITAGALAAAHAIRPGPHAVRDLIVATVANLVGTGLRFVIMRTRIFRPPPARIDADTRPEVMSRDLVLSP